MEFKGKNESYFYVTTHPSNAMLDLTSPHLPGFSMGAGHWPCAGESDRCWGSGSLPSLCERVRMTDLGMVLPWVKPCLRQLSQRLSFQSSLLLLMHCVGQQVWHYVLGALHSLGRPRWSSRFLASAWCLLGFCEIWGVNQKMEYLLLSFLSLGCSAFQVDENK